MEQFPGKAVPTTLAQWLARLPGCQVHLLTSALNTHRWPSPSCVSYENLFDTVGRQTSYCWPENVHLKQVHGQETHVLSSGLSKVREPGKHIMGMNLVYCQIYSPELKMF